MTRVSPSFLGLRASSLALVRFSSRPDLQLTAPNADIGLDFLVSILHLGRATGRIFGLVVKAVSGDKLPTGALAGDVRYPVDTPFPILLVYYTMTDDRGYYAWLRPPVEPWSPDGKRLRIPRADFRDLNGRGLEDIVSQVNRWYDERQGTVSLPSSDCA